MLRWQEWTRVAKILLLIYLFIFNEIWMKKQYNKRWKHMDSLCLKTQGTVDKNTKYKNLKGINPYIYSLSQWQSSTSDFFMMHLEQLYDRNVPSAFYVYVSQYAPTNVHWLSQLLHCHKAHTPRFHFHPQNPEACHDTTEKSTI